MNGNSQGFLQLAASISLILCLGLTIFAVWTHFRLQRVQSRLTKSLGDVKASDLSEALKAHFDERAEMRQTIKSLQERLTELEAKMQSSKRHLGIVRYDAFEEVGGAQSFALALFDDRGDGAILTSQVGRADCRVYCKPLLRGRSERTLSQEESRAMVEAYDQGKRPMITS